MVEKNILKKDIKNILVRAPNWIGDIMLATPALSALRKTFSAARISVLIKTEMASLLEDNPDIDEIISFAPEKMSVWSRLSFYRALSSKKIDLAVLLTNSFESALAAFLCKTRERVGYSRDLRQILLTKGIATPPRVYPRMHQSRYYLNLISALSSMSTVHRPPLSDPVKFNIPQEVSESVDILWEKLGLDQSQLTVGFGVGAAFGSAKRWPIERFTMLGRRIVKELGGRVVIFGGKEDQRSGDRIVCGMKEGGVSMAGKKDLKSFAAMIRKCRLYITNDSGPMHIAAAVGTPIIAIFGSTDPSETSPLSDSFLIVRKKVECSPCWKKECPTDHCCMDSISVDDIMEAVYRLGVTRLGGAKK